MAIFKEADVTSSNMADRIQRYPGWPTGCDVIQDGRQDVSQRDGYLSYGFYSTYKRRKFGSETVELQRKLMEKAEVILMLIFHYCNSSLNLILTRDFKVNFCT